MRMLHLAGEHRSKAEVPTALIIETRSVYTARLHPLEDPGPVDAVLLFSPRSARHFASEWDRLGRGRAGLALVAISPAAATAAGPGWATTAIADTPDEAALLLALQRLSL
jgi:uroporphyrinogen-III synthase